MSIQAVEKGKDLEYQVEEILNQNDISFEREKRIKGFGKHWRVDFFLPKRRIIIECKNINSRNMKRYLKLDCLKFLDIRNRFLQMNFILVIPKPTFSMGSFCRFCTSYNIKLTTINDLLMAFEKKPSELNQKFGELLPRKDFILKLIKASREKGLTKQDLKKKLGWTTNASPSYLQADNLNKYGVVRSIFSPRRYFSKESYEESNEFKLIKDLKTNHLLYSDQYLANKYGFSMEQVANFRREKLGLHKHPGWNWRRNRNTPSLSKYLS